MKIYDDLGVRPVINATGTVTRLGGASMPPEVLAAFHNAATTAVSLEELQAAAARRIAAATKTESGLVTSGASAALTLGATAILCRNDIGRMERLPDCTGFPHEFLVAREHRSGYDHAVRAAGAQLVDVGMNERVSGAGVRRTEAWEFAAAVTQKTAGILYTLTSDSCPSLAEVVAVGREHRLPVLVDAAAELPPVGNLYTIPATGADLVAFSGGKAIRGPQSTGILCGRRDLISSAAVQMLDMDDHPELWDPPPDLIDRSTLAGMPRHGIGRGLKVSKEEVVALLTALDLFQSGVWAAEKENHLRWIEDVRRELQPRAVRLTVETETTPEHSPVLFIDVTPTGRSAMEICRELRAGDPSVFVGHSRLHDEILTVNPVCLSETQLPDLIRQLRAAI